MMTPNTATRRHQDQEEPLRRMATDRSATRLGLSRRSRGVIRRLTRGESSGVVGWLTIGGKPPPPVPPTDEAVPAAAAAGTKVAMLLRAAPAAARGWFWKEAHR